MNREIRFRGKRVYGDELVGVIPETVGHFTGIITSGGGDPERIYEHDMFDDCDEGLDGDGFVDRLNQYVYDNHYDDKIDDIAKDWQLPRYELVKKVLDELKKEE